MKVKTMNKRLVLNKETVAALNLVDMDHAKGGATLTCLQTVCPVKSCPPWCPITDAVSNCSCVTCP